MSENVYIGKNVFLLHFKEALCALFKILLQAYLPECYTMCHFNVYQFRWFSVPLNFQIEKKAKKKTFSGFGPTFRE